jgi:hypothetical protein
MKGVGRIYQQPYIDTYAKSTQAKLHKTMQTLEGGKRIWKGKLID